MKEAKGYYQIAIKTENRLKSKLYNKLGDIVSLTFKEPSLRKEQTDLYNKAQSYLKEAIDILEKKANYFNNLGSSYFNLAEEQTKVLAKRKVIAAYQKSVDDYNHALIALEEKDNSDRKIKAYYLYKSASFWDSVAKEELKETPNKNIIEKNTEEAKLYRKKAYDDDSVTIKTKIK